MQRIRDAFSNDFVKAKAGIGHDSEAPVFVVGMPRSGTSLVEQSSQPSARLRRRRGRSFRDRNIRNCAARGERVPDMLAKMSNEDFRELGRAYVERMSREGAAKDRIVDKLPSNFLFAGLIHLALPGARNHPCQTQCHRHLRVLLLASVCGRAAIRLRPRRDRPLLPGLRDADGPLAVRAAAGTNARSGV